MPKIYFLNNKVKMEGYIFKIYNNPLNGKNNICQDGI